MTYTNVTPAVFIDRPNRFIARVNLEGKTETVHVKNTGRCRELLRPGAEVWLAPAQNPARRTAYDLAAAQEAGVEVLYLPCRVTPGSLTVNAPWEV